MQLRDPLGGGS
ncbi:hypothetical protein LINGRAHAP2_LOCUS13681 [Linum grandiflorum]